MATLERPDGSRLFYRLVGPAADRSPGMADATGIDQSRGQPNSQSESPSRRQANDAPALLFVHGWCSNHTHWIHQTRHFRRRHQVLLVDRRGHGKSTTSGTGHDAITHAADLLAVVRAAGLKSVVAIGHAGGGAGTLEFIRSNPRLVRAGVLVDTGLYPLPVLNSPESPFGAIVGGMIAALEGRGAKAAFRRMYGAYFDPRGDRDAAARAVAEAAATPDVVKIAELHGMMVDTAAIAAGIRQPILWLTAAQAPQAFIAKHLRKVGFAQVYGAHHFPHFEQPAQTNAAIDAFLARL